MADRDKLYALVEDAQQKTDELNLLLDQISSLKTADDIIEVRAEEKTDAGESVGIAYGTVTYYPAPLPRCFWRVDIVTNL